MVFVLTPYQGVLLSQLKNIKSYIIVCETTQSDKFVRSLYSLMHRPFFTSFYSFNTRLKDNS